MNKVLNIVCWFLLIIILVGLGMAAFVISIWAGVIFYAALICIVAYYSSVEYLKNEEDNHDED